MKPTSVVKPDRPRLAGTDFYTIEKFLQSGRKMNGKAIGTGTRANLYHNQDTDVRSIIIYCYGRPIVFLAEKKPYEVRFKIYWNTPADRGRITKFLPENVYLRGMNNQTYLIAEGVRFPVTPGLEYIWNEQDGLSEPTDGKL